MADTADIVTLGATKLSSKNVPITQAAIEIGEDESDTEDFGQIDMMPALGYEVCPWPADADGKAEGVILKGCGGTNAVCIGGRDTRFAKLAGNLKPGDVVIHTVGPSQAAQLQLKEEKKQALLVTKTTDGKTAVCGLDGKNDKFTVAIFGYLIEASKENGINLVDKTGNAGIKIKDGMVWIFGTVVLGGRTPIAPVLTSLVPVVGSPGTGVPSPGVFVGG